MDIFEKYLRFLDFSEEELPEILPQWKQACRLLDLSEENLRFSMEDWLPLYWDISLRGVRKCIGAYIREFIELTRMDYYKEQGAKILYYNMPSHPACMYANELASGGQLHISYPDYVIATVFNAFFHKDASGNTDTPYPSPLCHHCGMNRVKASNHFRGKIAQPTVLWNWGLYCNEGHKIEELTNNTEKVGWNYVLTTIPQDSTPGLAEAEDEKRVAYLANQLRDSQKLISAHTGVDVSEEDLIKATEEYLDYLFKVEKLTELSSRADPQPISGNDLTIFQVPSQIAFDTGLGYLSEALTVMLEEVEEKAAKGLGPLPRHSPRLACHFIPFSVPWINKAFIDNGVNLSINTFFALASRQAAYFDKNDIYSSVARQWLSNPSVVNMHNEAELVCEILEKYPQDGVLYGFFDFGCWIGSLKKTMIKIVEAKMGIPHYYFESEFWNDERYSLEDRIDRIKSIAYRVKVNSMINGWNNGKEEANQ